MSKITLHNGFSQEVLKQYEDNSIDCVVCDPPYGISFMGKNWDKALPPKEVWTEVYRVLKPGGYILAMSATRTYHRLAVQLEDMGFIVHPMIGWIFGSGFPKATDLGKQFDKQAGKKRKVIGKQKLAGTAATLKGKSDRKDWKDQGEGGTFTPEIEITEPATKLAKKWDGWKYGLQSLKPALEPCFMGQKPISEKRMTDNVRKHGVGAVNVDACRVKSDDKPTAGKRTKTFGTNKDPVSGGEKDLNFIANNLGRFPANLIHDGITLPNNSERFFYCAKPSKKEKDQGLESFPIKKVETRTDKGAGLNLEKGVQPGRNNHPTVKPVALMEYLIKLVCPKDGTVLDPFMGSGTTGIAAKNLDVNFVGIELDKGYFNIAKKRIGENNEFRNN